MERAVKAVASFLRGAAADEAADVREKIQLLQEELLQTPLALDVSVQMVQQETQTDSETEPTFSHEQKMVLEGKFPSQQFKQFNANFRKDESSKTHIILLVDRSGSMSGKPFSQVKLALREIMDQAVYDELKVVDVILYDSTASQLALTVRNYGQVIDSLKIGGSTNFKAAFDETINVISKTKNIPFKETVIIFLTDGCDTCNGKSQANFHAKAWANTIKDQGHQVIVHSVGFSRDHDLQFLKKIAHAGTAEGIYRYCENDDGPEALKDKLEELFDYVNLRDGRPVHFDISMTDGSTKLVSNGSTSGTIEGVLMATKREDGTHEDMQVKGECWLYVADSTLLPTFQIGMQMEIIEKRNKFNLQIPCLVNSVNRVVLKSESERALWNIAVLSRNADILGSQLSDAVTAGADVSKLQKRLDVLQKKLANAEVFRPGFNKATREELIELIKENQSKMDRLHDVMAQCLRGEAQSVSLLARAHDLRYEAKFNKSRRQRLMNRRVAQNFNVVKSDTQTAKVACEEDLVSLSQDALEFYLCILSQCSVKDILLDGTDLGNAIGIGLAVSRPEHVIDDPTSIRVHSISASLVSRSSIMDALEYKINLGGQLSAHGGFYFGSQSSEFGYATVGAGREPINAWLPLYVHPVHWERVKSCLRPSLGYLCTLDPLAYSESQMDVLFMVLGNMISQLYKHHIGENQLKLIFALQSTCNACMKDFGLLDKITEKIEAFVSSPMGRFKDSIPNLFTLIGYLVSVPMADVKKILGISPGADAKTALSKLWVTLLSEVLRRGSLANTEFHESEAHQNGLLKTLLHGRRAAADTQQANTASLSSEHLGQLCWSLSSTPGAQWSVNILQYNPAEDVPQSEATIKCSSAEEKAIELWAQHKCGEIKNKNRSDQVKEAKKTVKAWIERVREKVGKPMLSPGKAQEVTADTATVDSRLKEIATLKAADFDTTVINSSILKVTAKVLTKLSQSCYPPLAGLPGCVGFLEFWITSSEDVQDMQLNGGMPPAHWISGVKDAVSRIYQKMDDFKKACADAARAQGEGASGQAGDEDDDDDDEDFRSRGEGPLEQKEESEGEEYYDEVDADAVAIRRRRHQGVVTIPMLLRALNLEGDAIELVRAMLCQAVGNPRSSQARTSFAQGEFLDLSVAGNARASLQNVESVLIRHREAAILKIQDRQTWEIGNRCMLRADSIWSFIGYLMLTYKERGEGFSSLIDLILTTPDIRNCPLIAEKILILLSGKYQDHVVFAKGNAWVPDKKMSKQFERVLGEEEWLNIERELLSNVEIHVYRESDIPNRHSHCNSNPYIPNRLRKVLSIPLNEKEEQPRTSLRHKSLQKKT